MRIHTDRLVAAQTAIHDAVAALPGVRASMMPKESRSRSGAIELRLTGRNGRLINTGRYGAGDEHAATWDEWGVVLAAVLACDPSALVGSARYPVYDGAEDFHWVTGGRFRQGVLPADTHATHLWVHRVESGWVCRGCSATRHFRKEGVSA